MYQKIQLFGLLFFSLLLTSCEPEAIPEMEQPDLNSRLEIHADDSGNEEAPIDDEKED
uniref:hypothetical protein n=1 Tax=uncultured Christiangramia sp. TaxID=503836 RepID=UPI002618B4D3|nr:hypothetical protein [uncultured Christiangramia sp.]